MKTNNESVSQRPQPANPSLPGSPISANRLSCPGIPTRTGLRAGKPLGDAIADVTQATGLNRLAHWYTGLTGQDCGCERRRQVLNQLFP